MSAPTAAPTTSPPMWPPMEICGTANVSNKLMPSTGASGVCQMLRPAARWTTSTAPINPNTAPDAPAEPKKPAPAPNNGGGGGGGGGDVGGGAAPRG